MNGIYLIMKKKRVPGKIAFLFIGAASTLWFLVRVIPKPSRAAYPCMRTAAPLMSGFILYLITLSGSALIFRRARTLVKKRRYLLATTAFVASLIILGISTGVKSGRAGTVVAGSTADDYPANEPYGTGIGQNPGRVVWAWDPDATDEHCTNSKDDPVRGADGYFLEKNNNREVIREMMENTVKRLTGAATLARAWDSLFMDLNRRKGKGPVSYRAGEDIFIKINQGGAGWLTNEGPDDDLSFINKSWTKKYYGMAESGPWVVIEILNQLVNEYGIPQGNILVGDPIAHIYKYHYDVMYSVFPGVHYVDIDPEHADIGRTILNESSQPCIFYSDKGTVMTGAVSEKLYQEMENADYLINIATLKAHALAGITLTTKNHFGSHTRADASHLHPGLLGYVDDDPYRTEYGVYRVLTDLMGHEKLGGNTVLFLVDGLWGGTEATERPVRWEIPPFNGDWPNSIFASQDQVALESVCFDFLRSEFDDPVGPGKARPWMGGVDDHLHQAADSRFWPEGIMYDPENDGIPIQSLGVHEHWNNLYDKQYSGNLGQRQGIELVRAEELENHMVEIIGIVPDFEITETESDLLIAENMASLFFDPDGDELQFTVRCSEPKLHFTVDPDRLSVRADSGYEGSSGAGLVATDGEFEAVILFRLFRERTHTGERIILGEGISCFPNPFEQKIYLEMDRKGLAKDASVRIYSIHGRMVSFQQMDLTEGEMAVTEIDLGDKPPGLYVIELHSGEMKFSSIIRKN